jgi:hypothetical protein
MATLLKAISRLAGQHRVEVPFARVMPPEVEWWHGVSMDGLAAGIGLSDARHLQEIAFNDNTVHALVAGQTGTGKSNLLHAIVVGLALRYSPEELELYLVDLKEGVEFKCYTPSDAQVLPHARVIAITNEREFAVSCLEGLAHEIKRRGDLFREAQCPNLLSYRKATGLPLARIVVVIDEFHELFSQKDSLEVRAEELLGYLAKEGRGFGIHLLLATQSLSGPGNLHRSILGQIAIRLALRTTDADSRTILAEDNAAAASLMRQGEAIYNSANGSVAANNLFQAALLAPGARDALLRSLAGRSRERPRDDAVIFEGNQPARIGQCATLRLRSQTATLVPGDRRPVHTWLGMPVAIKGPTEARFARIAGCNLAVVGRDERPAIGMLAGAILSVAMQLPPDAVQFVIFDRSSPDAPWVNLFPTLAQRLPHPVTMIESSVLRRQLEQVAQAASSASERRLFLIGVGFHRHRDLRAGDEAGYAPRGDEPPSLRQLLNRVVREGPDDGVHTIGWWDSVANLRAAGDRDFLREFGFRAVLPVSDADSRALLESGDAARLRSDRALLWQADLPSSLEKFIPFTAPSPEELNQVLQSVREKWNA